MRRALARLTAPIVLTLPTAVLSPQPALAVPVIQPGASITMDGSFCTLNWIYDGTGALTGRTFTGTAAHCVSSVGQPVSLASGSLGSPVQEIGKVAFIAPTLDYAFIEIAPANLALVNPALKGHPAIPAGVSTTDTAATGDLVQFSGNGVGFHLLPLTQESRVGVLHSNDGTQHYVIGAVSPGDSGGPVADLTDGNKALGIVNTVGVGVANGLPYAGEGGVSLQGMFADAAANGFTLRLRTV